MIMENTDTQIAENGSRAAAIVPEKATTLSEYKTWRGQYLGLHYKITHSEMKESSYLPYGTWCYYVYLHERYIPDFKKKLWLRPKLIQTSPEHWGFVSHKYSTLEAANVDWHGGCTYYDKHGELPGYRCVELGCDYQHFFDTERGFAYCLEEVQMDCHHTIRELVELLGFKEGVEVMQLRTRSAKSPDEARSSAIGETQEETKEGLNP